VSVLRVRLTGQLMTGNSLSLTVTVKDEEPVLLDASVAIQVMVVVPLANVEPPGGVQVTLPTPEQLSVAVGVVKLTTAEHWLVSVPLVILAGTDMEGACVSLMVTVKVQEPLLPEESATVQEMVVVPLENGEPDAGVQLTAPTPEQLSLAIGKV
jgi:hypothetical protein